jgi:fructoselysine and glucoselysine-specific PTS system IIC component
LFAWYFILLPSASAWIALLEADWVLVGQFMISRPIVVGPMIGLALGGWQAGLVFGVLFELLSLEEEPVGTTIPINGTVGAGSGVLLAAGPYLVPMAVAFPAAVGLGWLHKRIEMRLREQRASLTLEVAQQINSMGRPNWEKLTLKTIGLQVASSMALVYVAAALCGPLLSALWRVFPDFMRTGLVIAFEATVWISLAALLRQLARKR